MIHLPNKPWENLKSTQSKNLTIKVKFSLKQKHVSVPNPFISNCISYVSIKSRICKHTLTLIVFGRILFPFNTVLSNSNDVYDVSPDKLFLLILLNSPVH